MLIVNFKYYRSNKSVSEFKVLSSEFSLNVPKCEFLQIGTYQSLAKMHS